ncbi:MAG: hypothetical protein U0T77_12980 [Chitinophagales bacterium]
MHNIVFSETKKNRIVKLYNLYKNTGQDEFPFNDKEIKGGLNIYFGRKPKYTLFSFLDIIEQKIYVGIDEYNSE